MHEEREGEEGGRKEEMHRGREERDYRNTLTGCGKLAVC